MDAFPEKVGDSFRWEEIEDSEMIRRRKRTTIYEKRSQISLLGGKILFQKRIGENGDGIKELGYGRIEE